MGATKVNWDDQQTWQRVVAAIIATGVKVDLRQTALYFGTTYDTLENRFRKIKKEAEVLKTEVASGERVEISTPSRSTPKKATPKKDALTNVTNGRVSKPSSKKKSTIKQEALGESTSFEDVADFSFTNDGGSFNFDHGINGEDDDGFGLMT